MLAVAGEAHAGDPAAVRLLALVLGKVSAIQHACERDMPCVARSAAQGAHRTSPSVRNTAPLARSHTTTTPESVPTAAKPRAAACFDRFDFAASCGESGETADSTGHNPRRPAPARPRTAPGLQATQE